MNLCERSHFFMACLSFTGLRCTLVATTSSGGHPAPAVCLPNISPYFIAREIRWPQHPNETVTASHLHLNTRVTSFPFRLRDTCSHPPEHSTHLSAALCHRHCRLTDKTCSLLGCAWRAVIKMQIYLNRENFKYKKNNLQGGYTAG